MSSLPENQACGICSGNLAAGNGQSIFTAECSHSFHFGCISNNASNFCPVCHAIWNGPPFPFARSNISTKSRFCKISVPRAPSYPLAFEPEPEPFWFSDDEPLPASVDQPTLSGLGLEKVSIRAIPERPSVAASEVLSEFSVLVGLKGPSLPDNEHRMQRAAIDLVTVLDISGSMYGSKLALLKRAVHFVIDNLGPSDRLSIVSFSYSAQRILPLRRMTYDGREQAKRAVDSLCANGATNIVAALKKGAKVLEERRQSNPVANIIFLSDGNDTCYYDDFSNPGQKPAYLHLLPASICPRNRGSDNAGQQKIFPVHTFGFGTDHDPLAMHAIANASGGIFSFIESYEMVQDAFAGCIGGLLSVVTQELRLTLRSASHGVEIKSIPSGRFASEIYNQGSQGMLNVGDLYAEEEKEFLINLSVPSIILNDDDAEMERKTSLLDITFSYRDVVSNEMVQIEADLVEIRRPKLVSSQDMLINLEVDRQRNRLSALLTITEAQQMAEAGNLTEAQALLSNKRSKLMSTVSAQAGDGLCMWLNSEMTEIEKRMQSKQLYEQQGRAYALSGMSSHAYQRAATRGQSVAGAEPFASNVSFSGGAAPVTQSAAFGAYATPKMRKMVNKSRERSMTEGVTTIEE